MVQHCSDDDFTTRPLLLVTASVDRIVLKKPISVDSDLRISGSVIWVGMSSIEIQLDVGQAIEGTGTFLHPIIIVGSEMHLYASWLMKSTI